MSFGTKTILNRVSFYRVLLLGGIGEVQMVMFYWRTADPTFPYETDLMTVFIRFDDSRPLILWVHHVLFIILYIRLQLLS